MFFSRMKLHSLKSVLFKSLGVQTSCQEPGKHGCIAFDFVKVGTCKGPSQSRAAHLACFTKQGRMRGILGSSPRL